MLPPVATMGDLGLRSGCALIDFSGIDEERCVTQPSSIGLRRAALVLTAAGLIGVAIGVCLWTLGGAGARGNAIASGGLGFAALCFGNAAQGILGSIRPTSRKVRPDQRGESG